MELFDRTAERIQRYLSGDPAEDFGNYQEQCFALRLAQQAQLLAILLSPIPCPMNREETLCWLFQTIRRGRESGLLSEIAIMPPV
jgi:hypothetical protein